MTRPVFDVAEITPDVSVIGIKLADFCGAMNAADLLTCRLFFLGIRISFQFYVIAVAFFPKQSHHRVLACARTRISL